MMAPGKSGQVPNSDTFVEGEKAQCSATSDFTHCRIKQQDMVLERMLGAKLCMESAKKTAVAALTDASASDPLVLEYVVGYLQKKYWENGGGDAQQSTHMGLPRDFSMGPASFDKALCMASHEQPVTIALEDSISPPNNEVILETLILPSDTEPAASADVSTNTPSTGNSQTPEGAFASVSDVSGASLLQQLLETHRESVSGQSASLDANAFAEIGNETPMLENLLQSMMEPVDVAQPSNAVDSPDSTEEESLYQQPWPASTEEDSDAMELLKQMMRVDISSTA